MPWWANASPSCLKPTGFGRGIIRTINEYWEKICNCWFKLATLRRQIWGNDQLSCSFGLRPPHLTLKWKSGQDEVGFLSRAVTGAFHVNFSQLEGQQFHPYQFYCVKWEFDNIFLQECITVRYTSQQKVVDHTIYHHITSFKMNPIAFYEYHHSRTIHFCYRVIIIVKISKHFLLALRFTHWPPSKQNGVDVEIFCSCLCKFVPTASVRRNVPSKSK